MLAKVLNKIKMQKQVFFTGYIFLPDFAIVENDFRLMLSNKGLVKGMYQSMILGKRDRKNDLKLSFSINCKKKKKQIKHTKKNKQKIADSSPSFTELIKLIMHHTKMFFKGSFVVISLLHICCYKLTTH